MTPKTLDRLARLETRATPTATGKHLVFQVDAPAGTPIGEITAFLRDRGHAIHDGDEIFVMNLGAYTRSAADPRSIHQPAVGGGPRDGPRFGEVADGTGLVLHLHAGWPAGAAMTLKLTDRLVRLEAASAADAAAVRGVSGILAACARDRADHLARGISGEEYEAAMAALPKPRWYVNLHAAMAGDCDESRS